MTEKETPQWTDDELQLLKHEAFVSEVSRLRGSKKEDKSLVLRLLESPGGVALITVLIGGLFGGFISSCYQREAKEREFQQSWLKGQGEQALASYHQYMNQEKELVARIHTIIGSCLAHSEDLIRITDPVFTKDYAHARKTIKKQQETIIDRFNETDRKWRSERDELTLHIRYYHPNAPDVVSAWEKVKTSMEAYMGICVSKWFEDHITQQEETTNACSTERLKLESSLTELSSALARNRRFAWEGWETPDSLRRKLEQH